MYLIGLLKENNLNDRNSVLDFLKNKSNCEALELKEIIPERKGIEFDSSFMKDDSDESKGLPVNSYFAQNSIINLRSEHPLYESLEITDFNHLLFRDVVVIGNILIKLSARGKRDSSVSIIFDNVVVFGQIEFQLCSECVKNIEVRKSAIDSIWFSGPGLCEKLDITGSSIGVMTFHNVNIKDFELLYSQVEAFRINENVLFGRKRLGRTEINIDKTFDLNKDDIYDVKWNVLPKYKLDAKTARIITKDSGEIIFQKTYEFLKSFSVGISLEDSAAITNKKLFHDNKKVIAYIHKFLNWFLKPFPIAASLLSIIIFCAWIYTGKSFFASYLNNDDLIMFNFGQALYYSAVTFTTIGYGDYVSEEPLVRIISVFEGMLGVLFGGAFLVALTRTYLDFHNSRFKN